MHLLHRSKHDAGCPSRLGLSTLVPLAIVAGLGCYHPVLIASATPHVAARQAEADSVAKAERKIPPRCRSYVLLVENALPRAVEIYEVGHNSDRIVAIAQIGFTEVPMTESTQQFVAVSRGEVMAAATNSDNRSGDRVALQRSCRPY